jgi:conjugal transfer pilus assembly protein TraV
VTREWRLPVVLITSLLSGCALTPLGESDYRCPLPDGAGRCQPVRETYARDSAAALAADPTPPAADRPAGSNPRLGFNNQNGDHWWNFLTPRDPPPPPDPPLPAAVPALVPLATLPPPTPPTPDALLTPARVLRIWVAPFQDGNGDLHAPGLVYTEVVPRRWAIGLDAPPATVALTPLQVEPPREAAASEERSVAGRLGRGQPGR